MEINPITNITHHITESLPSLIPLGTIKRQKYELITFNYYNYFNYSLDMFTPLRLPGTRTGPRAGIRTPA